MSDTSDAVFEIASLIFSDFTLQGFPQTPPASLLVALASLGHCTFSSPTLQHSLGQGLGNSRRIFSDACLYSVNSSDSKVLEHFT